MMPISEIFYSIQGEGKLSGVPSVFIRVAGCNLHCAWCDTKYASAPEKNSQTNSDSLFSIEQIIEKILAYPTQYVVITGGEPTTQEEVCLLSRQLHQFGKHITLETNATKYQPSMYVDLVSMSPKLSHSIPMGSCWEQYQTQHRLSIESIISWMSHVSYLPTRFQLKWVVSSPQDINEIQDILRQISTPTFSIPPENILLMPIGTNVDQMEESTDWLIAQCLQYGYRFCPRLHIYLFGGKRGK